MTTSPRVDIFVDGLWTDITEDVRLNPGISITRGRADEQSSTNPSTCRLHVNNDGTYSPRNPTSTLYGKIGRNTPIRVSNTAASDSYTRTESNGLGTSDSGHVWSVAGGAASVYSVSSGSARIAAAAVNTSYAGYLDGLDIRDGVISVKVTPGVVATGGTIDMAVTARRSATTDFYAGVVRINTDSSATLMLTKVVAGVTTTLASAAANYTYDATTQFGIELTCQDEYLAVRVWDTDDEAGTTETITDTDTAHQQADAAGIRVMLASANSNTLPVTVQFDDFQVLDGRFVGEVVAWPSRWDPTGNDVYVPIEAAGITRRLQQGTALRSALYRAITTGWTDLLPGDLIAYWPLEDGAGSTQAASGIPGKQAMKLRTGITFASADGPDGSDSLPDVNTSSGRLTGQIPGHPVSLTEHWWASCVFKASGTGSFSPLEVAAAGTLSSWRVVVSTSSAVLTVRDGDGTTQATPTISTNYLDGEWHVLTVYGQVGLPATDVTCWIRVDDDLDTDTATTETLGQALRIFTPGAAAPSNMTSAQVGHIQVWAAASGEGPTGVITAAQEAMAGYAGELAGDRIVRLCAEEGVTVTVRGDTADTAPVGAQRIATLPDLLQDAEGADQGILDEGRTVAGYRYRTLVNLLNQDATLTLDYSAAEVVPPFEPTDDDQLTRNDVTATKLGGSSARVTVTAGALSVNDPPDGVGVYGEQIGVNVAADLQLPSVASWRGHLGTWNEPRYPSVAVECQKSGFSKADLSRAVDTGDIITITDLPAWMPPDDANLMVRGSTEYLDAFLNTIVWNTSPAGPYTVPVWGSSTSASDEASSPDHYDTAGSETTTAFIAGTNTALPVLTTLGPYWTTSANDVPFEIGVSGARLNVTAISSTVTDAYGRTSNNSWGSADSGQAWTNSGGSQNDYDVAAGVGTQANTAVNDLHRSKIEAGSADVDFTVDVALSITSATTQPATTWVAGRLTDDSNYYAAALSLATSGVMSLRIDKRVAGSLTNVVAATTLGANTAGNWWRVRFEIKGSSLNAKAWNTNTSSEPKGWLLSGTDTALTSGTQLGLMSRLETGNTNTLPVTWSWDALSTYTPQTMTVDATAVNGVSKTIPAGSDVRLWTPTVYSM